MTVEVALIERVLAIAEVTAIVSTRVYQLILPQQPTLPAVRVQLIDEVPSYHARGMNDLMPSRIQVDAFAAVASNVDAYSAANDLAAAIDGNWVDGSPGPPRGLSGFRGELGGSPAAFFVGMIRRVDRAVLYEPDELRLVRVRQDYIVWWKAL